MTNEEAKFILSAYRPNGADAEDKVFREALGQSVRDPELRNWLEKQRAFDRAIALKLGCLQPPSSLAIEMLALARVSARPQSRALRWTWRFVSFAVVLGCAAIVLQRWTTRQSVDEFSSIALRDVAESSREHLGQNAELNDLQIRLASISRPWSRALSTDMEELAKRHCRKLELGKHGIFEVCFYRSGTWYHLYVADRGDFNGASSEPRVVAGPGDFTCVTWSYSGCRYALVAEETPEVLRRMI